LTPSLVVQTSFLGDMVLTTPLLAELATRGPVDVVATPANAALLAHHPAVREVIVFDKRRSARGIGGLSRIATRLRDAGYGTAYLAQGSMRSATLARLAMIPERVGFESSAGRWLYTRRVPYRDDLHHAERLWQLAMPAGARAEAGALRPRLYPGEEHRAAVDTALRGSSAEHTRFVALAPGSVWATKRWPYYADVARQVAPEFPIVIVGAAVDGDAARAVASVAPGRNLDLTGRLPLLASAELLRRAAALVTNDSAPMHLASAMGTPTLAVFGPTVPEFGFGPLAPRAVTLGHEALACRPCDRHGPPECPLGHWRCMREIPPDHVAKELRRLVATVNA
jgi:heptosyltransferase-2